MKGIFQRLMGYATIVAIILCSSISTRAASYRSEYLDEAISGLRLYNILEGYGYGDYGENDYLTREQMAAFISRANHLNDDDIDLPFTDTISISNWALSSVNGCYKNGVIDGYNDGSFRPRDLVTTAEAVKMVVETIEETTNPSYPDGYMEYAKNNGMLYDIDNDKNDYITRGDVFKLIYTSYDKSRVIHLEDYIIEVK